VDYLTTGLHLEGGSRFRDTYVFKNGGIYLLGIKENNNQELEQT